MSLPEATDLVGLASNTLRIPGWPAFPEEHFGWARTGTTRKKHPFIASWSALSGWTSLRSPTGNSESSSRPRATSPSPRSRPTRRTIRAHSRTC